MVFLDKRINVICDEMKKYAEEHPQKIARINRMVEILNTTEDIPRFKQAYNEINRLIYWKDIKPSFSEPEANPDLLGE